MLADMLSNFYNTNKGYLEEISYMRDFKFEDENDTFVLTFDPGIEEEGLYPTWIIQDTEMSTFDSFYMELTTEELIHLHQLVNNAIDKLKEYEAKLTTVNRITNE